MHPTRGRADILTRVTRRGSLFVALLAVATSTTAQSVRLTLAIVRPDGHLVPFAAYDNGRWARAWPAADELTDDEPTFENIPSVWRRRGVAIPRTWQVWPTSGAQPIQARVKDVAIVDAHCGAQVALKTDLPSVKTDHPRKFGVAVDPNHPVAAIEAVPQSDDAWKSAERVIAGRLADLEGQRARADGVQLPAETPVPAARIIELYRESRSARSPLYFVAEKPYRTARARWDPQCAAKTLMTGWLLRANDRLILRAPRIFLTDCDAKEARTAWPLGVLHLAGQSFWILQEHGYEDETYVVAEVGRASIGYPLTVNGGGC